MIEYSILSPSSLILTALPGATGLPFFVSRLKLGPKLPSLVPGKTLLGLSLVLLIWISSFNIILLFRAVVC
jgi:hypothetical protein